MDTIIQSPLVNFSASEVKVVNVEVKTDSISDFWQKVEFYRFGITPILLVIIAILGGLTGAVGIEESTVKLSLVAIPTMFALSMILAVTPRTIIISCTTALIIDLLVFIF